LNNSNAALTEITPDSDRKFRNIFDYILEEQSTFAEKPFCAEDSVLLTQLTYFRMGDYVKGFRPYYTFSTSLKSLDNDDALDNISRSIRVPDDTRRLLSLAAKSRRFGGIRIKYFMEHTDTAAEKQFAAMTFLLDSHNAFVAFRGTDNTIVGWRENFNMAYMTPVPSQTESAEYLRNVIGRLFTRKIYVGGHSKGGNLAVYAAMHCGHKEQQRIAGVYNLDGPGFKDDIVNSAEMHLVKDRVHSILPQSSMIGTLLKPVGWQMIVFSEGTGFAQHNPVNWHFTGNRLKEVDSLSRDAVIFDRVLDKWLESLDNPQRELIVDTMFDIIDNSGAGTFHDALDMIRNGDISALRIIKNMDPQTRRKLIPLFKNLGVEYIREKMRR